MRASEKRHRIEHPSFQIYSRKDVVLEERECVVYLQQRPCAVLFDVMASGVSVGFESLPLWTAGP